MKNIKLFLIFLFFISPVFGKGKYSDDSRLRNESEPVTMPAFSGITEVTGVSLGQGISLCKGSVTDDGWSSSRIIIADKNGELMKWSVDAGFGMWSYFSVVSVDFLGNEKFSPVLFNNLDWQNGTGITFYEVGILDKIKEKQILFFDTANNPDDPESDSEEQIDVFRFNKTKNRMEILSGEWTSYIGDYMYFVKRWFYYEKGELHPVLEKPVVKRGFGYLFAEWKDSGKTIICKKDPWLEDDMKTIEKVLIKDAQIVQVHDYFAIKFQLVTKNGPVEYIYSGDIEENQTNPSSFFIDRLGRIKTKRIFPSGYIPEEVKGWIGKTGSLETFPNKDSYVKQKSKIILWF